MSEVLKILLSTSVSETLPSFLETYTELNRNINFKQKKIFTQFQVFHIDLANVIEKVLTQKYL